MSRQYFYHHTDADPFNRMLGHLMYMTQSDPWFIDLQVPVIGQTLPPGAVLLLVQPFDSFVNRTWTVERPFITDEKVLWINGKPAAIVRHRQQHPLANPTFNLSGKLTGHPKPA